MANFPFKNKPRNNDIVFSVQFDWPANKWIKANVGQYGYYRVNYDRENWERLTNVLKTNQTVF